MGVAASWLAVRGRSRASVLHELCLAATGQFEEIPESPIVAVDLPGGWFIVLYNFFAGELDTIAMQLSIGCDVVMARMDENVLCSTASAWRDRCEIWSLMHDAQESHDHFQIRGTPPPEFAAIRQRLASKQLNSEATALPEDYLFDVPLALVDAMTGFRCDEPPADGVRFEVLQRHVPVGPAWGPDAILAAIKQQRSETGVDDAGQRHGSKRRRRSARVDGITDVRGRIVTSAALLGLGGLVMLLQNGQTYTNALAFLALSSLSLLIWVSISISRIDLRWLAVCVIAALGLIMAVITGSLPDRLSFQQQFNQKMEEIRQKGIILD